MKKLYKIDIFIAVVISSFILIISSFSFSLFNNTTIIPINSYEINYNLDIETCELIDVVDGDTLKVKINNKDESVRLLNVDTPECKHPNTAKNTEKGKIAYNFTKELLKDKKILYLTKDKNDRDKYNRLLRLVWLDIPINDSKEELLNKCLNAILVKESQAKVVRYDDYKYYKIFKEIKYEQ